MMENCLEDWDVIFNHVLKRKSTRNIWSILQRLVVAASVFTAYGEKEIIGFSREKKKNAIKMQLLNRL